MLLSMLASNVDSQFQKAGFDESKVFETHGSLAYQQCIAQCEGSGVWADPAVARGAPLNVNKKTFRIEDESLLPKCPSCKGNARPNVSFFSDTDNSFNNERQALQKRNLFQWLDTVKGKSHEKVLVVEIGCGTSIHSLRFETEILLYHTPELKDRVSMIRINPSHPSVEENSEFHVGIGAGAKESLLAIKNLL